MPREITDTTVGVVGGGQLCRMLGEAAAPLGIELLFLDPTPRAPAHPVAVEQFTAPFDDREALEELAERSDVLTYEIELADPDVLRAVREATGTPVHPHPETLRITKDKLREKRFLREHGLPVPDFRSVDSADDLDECFDALGSPAMLKLRRGGYDGRGNVPVDSPEEARRALDELPGDVLMEEMIDFDRELSAIGVQGPDKRDTFPVTETLHEEEILRCTVTPARTSQQIRARARSVALSVLEALGGRGVFGIEMFERDGEVLVNEIAPRPHNSGHWTIEGTHNSQFQQHLRAVAGQPPGSTALRNPAVTVNILGDRDRGPGGLTNTRSVMDHPKTHLHWYGKREVRRLRKMGHVTCVGHDVEELKRTTESVVDSLGFES